MSAPDVYDGRSAAADPRAHARRGDKRRHAADAYDVPEPLLADILRVLAPTAPVVACPFTTELTSGGTAT